MAQLANTDTLVTQVDMRKVKIEVLKPWIATRYTELNGFEDDIVSSMIIGLLEDKDNPVSQHSSPMRPLVRDVDTLCVDVRTALDLEGKEVALEDHGHDPREDTIVHLHPDHALDQNLRIEVVDVDRLREIGMMMIQVSSHPE